MFVNYIVIRCLAILKFCVMDRETGHVAVHGVAKSWTQLKAWIELKFCVIYRQLLLYSDFLKVFHLQQDSEEGPLDKYRSLINFRSYTNHSGWRQLYDFVNVLYKVEEISLYSYFVESFSHRDAGFFKIIFCIIWDNIYIYFNLSCWCDIHWLSNVEPQP